MGHDSIFITIFVPCQFHLPYHTHTPIRSMYGIRLGHLWVHVGKYSIHGAYTAWHFLMFFFVLLIPIPVVCFSVIYHGKSPCYSWVYQLEMAIFNSYVCLLVNTH